MLRVESKTENSKAKEGVSFGHHHGIVEGGGVSIRMDTERVREGPTVLFKLPCISLCVSPLGDPTTLMNVE